jgi:Bacterial membrane protein YfhO
VGPAARLGLAGAREPRRRPARSPDRGGEAALPAPRVHARLASGREISLPLRAGLDTAEWAWDRADLRARVAHYRAPVAESWPGPDGSFQGHRYQALLRLPGRYWVDGLRIERAPGPGGLLLTRIAVLDAVSGRAAAASAAAAFVSDTGRFREAAATPRVRLFELSVTSGRAFVAEALRTLPSEQAVLSTLAALGAFGVDPHRVAVGLGRDLAGVTLPPGSRAGRAEVVLARSDWIDVRAEGPGLLVLTDGWDEGWGASLDDAPARVLRVNHGEMGVVLPRGRHRVVFTYWPEGLAAGFALAAVGAGALAYLARRTRRRRG